MAPRVEARIVELRREHSGWGPRTLEHRPAREGIDPVPGRCSIHRCLIRHGLITPEARKRERADYKRWERSGPAVHLRRAFAPAAAEQAVVLLAEPAHSDG